MTRRQVRGVWGPVLALGLAACALMPSSPEEDEVPRPEWRVGDRWMFRRTTTAGDVTVVTHQVTQATGSGYRVRLTGLAQESTREWTTELHLREVTIGGRPATFTPPARYFVWPLTLGKTWTQEFEYRGGPQDGRYTNVWRVRPGIERISVLVGSFYTIRIEQWGSQGERLSAYWYTPQVRYWVRLESYVGGYTEELLEFGPPS